MPRAIALVRRLIDTVFPRGALILSFLSLGYFAMGLVRNRVFANTFGAGPELDAYNAAFRIPEIIFDVVVASGLTAPFVPLFPACAGRPRRTANKFARTVLTAVGAWRWRPRSSSAHRGSPRLQGFDQPTRDLYVQLLRINTLAQILFAASLGLGEILIATSALRVLRLRPDPVHDGDHPRHGPVLGPIRDRGDRLGRRGGRRRTSAFCVRSGRPGPRSGSDRRCSSGRRPSGRSSG